VGQRGYPQHDAAASCHPSTLRVGGSPSTQPTRKTLSGAPCEMTFRELRYHEVQLRVLAVSYVRQAMNIRHYT
jgi:hypothetical protein